VTLRWVEPSLSVSSRCSKGEYDRWMRAVALMFAVYSRREQGCNASNATIGSRHLLGVLFLVLHTPPSAFRALVIDEEPAMSW
jgi:hypothetical protein